MNLNCPITQVAPLLPHSGEMVLLDLVRNFGEDFLIAETTIKADNILIQNGKLNAFSGIEIMAQGIGAWAGCMAVQANEPVRLGYLLGTRKLHIYQDEIPVGSHLQINIKMSIQDATGFGVFDCQMIDIATQKVILEGALNVFSPKEEKQ